MGGFVRNGGSSLPGQCFPKKPDKSSSGQPKAKEDEVVEIEAQEGAPPGAGVSDPLNELPPSMREEIRRHDSGGGIGDTQV